MPLPSLQSTRASSRRSAIAVRRLVQRTWCSAAGLARASRVAGVMRRCADRLQARWRGTLRRHVAGLTRHETALRSHGAEVERAFISVGDALREQTRLAAELVGQRERFRSFTAESAAENPVRAALEFIAAELGRVEQLQRDNAELLSVLGAQHAAILRLRQDGAQLERAIAPLRIIDRLFRIEAAGLEADTQSAFAALTQEITRLDTQVRDTFAQHFEGLSAAANAIDSLRTAFGAQRADMDRLSQEQHAAMRAAVARLDQQIAVFRTQNERSAALVAEIDRETGSVVVNLQFQDITRQKLEHVVATLGAIATRADAGDRPALAFVRDASRLEACQLQAIDEDLRRASTVVDERLREIVERLQRLESECLAGGNGQAFSTRVTGAIDELIGMIAALAAPIDAATRGAADAAGAIRAFGGMTVDLGDTIRELTWGIRLIALNAQVQAAQVDHCDGLEVLARHTYLVSEETSRLADSVGRELGSVAEGLRQIVTRAERLSATCTSARADFTVRSRAAVSRLEQQRAELVAAMDAYPGLLWQTREHAFRLLERATLASVNRRPLQDAIVDFQLLEAWCRARHADGGDSTAISELKAHYTMQSEREVHDVSLGAPALEVPVSRREPLGTAPLREIEPQSDVDRELTVAGPAADGGDAAPTAALGDNVELF